LCRFQKKRAINFQNRASGSKNRGKIGVFFIFFETFSGKNRKNFGFFMVFYDFSGRALARFLKMSCFQKNGEGSIFRGKFKTITLASILKKNARSLKNVREF